MENKKIGLGLMERDLGAAFRALHNCSDIMVLPNIWDAGSALLISQLGFSALATTSAGIAFSLGIQDARRMITREAMLTRLAEIVGSTLLPVSADLENGYGDNPDIVAETIMLASELGVAGGSIEDATGLPESPIYEFSHAVERVAAAAEAARRGGKSFVLTARAENFAAGRPDLDDTIKRLSAFASAGADVLYAPGLSSLADISNVVRSLDKPVNVLMGFAGTSFNLQQLADVGVKRVSFGSSMARAAIWAMIEAAKEVRDKGTFEYANRALRFAEVQKGMRET